MSEPAILRCPECGVSWMHGDAPKHVMTCTGRYSSVGVQTETLDDAIDEIRAMVDGTKEDA